MNTSASAIPRPVGWPSGSALRIRFPEGILGFPGASTFDLGEGPGPGLFILSGVDPAAPTFVLADPFAYFEGYEVELEDRALRVVEATHACQIGVLAVTVPDLETGSWTANLQGPLVVNITQALATQVVLTGTGWSVRQPFTPSGRSAGPSASSLVTLSGNASVEAVGAGTDLARD